MTTYDFHPLAVLFPLMESAEFDELVADIKVHGLREPIVLHDRKILDGRNRYRACLKAGVEPVVRPLILGNRVADSELVNYVISTNLHRRHLTAQQKRDLVEKLLRAKPEVSNNAIATQVKIDDKTVAKVRRGMEARSEIPNIETRTDTKGRKQPAKKSAKKADRKQPAPKPVKPDPRIISPKLADRVGRFANDLILCDRLLAVELKNLIMLQGVRERLSADLTNGLALDDTETSAETRKAEFAELDDGTEPGPLLEILRRERSS
jgi:hypothetical protein